MINDECAFALDYFKQQSSEVDMADVVIERPAEPSVVIGLAEKLKLAPSDCAPSDTNVSASKLNFHCEDSNHALMPSG